MPFISFIDQYAQLVLLSMLCLFIGFAVVVELKVEFQDTRFYPFFKFTFGLVFVVGDWLVNLLISPVFFDLPGHRFELVTGRMARYKLLNPHKNKINRWRIGFAIWLCRHLNRYDNGHC